jgi:hypothetical protein
VLVNLVIEGFAESDVFGESSGGEEHVSCSANQR